MFNADCCDLSCSGKSLVEIDYGEAIDLDLFLTAIKKDALLEGGILFYCDVCGKTFMDETK